MSKFVDAFKKRRRPLPQQRAAVFSSKPSRKQEELEALANELWGKGFGDDRPYSASRDCDCGARRFHQVP